jgi:thiol peroxidase
MRNSLIILFFSTILLLFIGIGGCSTPSLNSDKSFSYKELPVAKGSGKAGEGETINFRGNDLVLNGKGIHVGEPLRSVKLTKTDLSQIDLVDTKGNVRIISIVPSLDTKVCEQQTHYLSEKNKGLDQEVKLITISVDTPFAQDRFAKEADITNILFLSDYRGGEFGKVNGLLLESPHLLTRAIMVVDRNNTIQFLQISPDLGHLPDMESAFQIARNLLTST